MKLRTLTLSILLGAFILVGCKQDTQALVNSKKNVYKEAVGLLDYYVATQAAYDILALDPNATSWKDTLATLYFERGNYIQALAMSRQIIKKNDGASLAIQTIEANAAKALGYSADALASYKAIYPKTKNINHLYSMANLEYELKEFEAMQTTIDNLLKDPNVETARVNLVFANRNQTVSMQAAVLNMKGVLFQDIGKVDEAAALFEAALKLEPDFLLAKGNLERMNNANENE